MLSGFFFFVGCCLCHLLLTWKYALLQLESSRPALHTYCSRSLEVGYSKLAMSLDDF
jgi:hypothetical protein